MMEACDRGRLPELLTKIAGCFLGFGSDPAKNIERLTALCGELLGATCAFYNRLEDGMLYTAGEWHSPPEFDPVSKAEGHICFDVIGRDDGEVLIVRNLPESVYAQTDPNVRRYGLMTYIGRAVRCGGRAVGSLCVVYDYDFESSLIDTEILAIIASAIGVEEERDHAERLYQTLAEKSFVGVYISHDGVFQFLNSKAASIAGYAPEEMMGTETLHIVHPEDRETVRRNAADMLQGRRSSPYEFRIVTRDGSIRWMMETVTSIKYAGKSALLANLMDITDIKEARWKLEEQQALESSILEAIPHAVIGLQHRRIIFANDAVERVLGWRPEELIGQKIRVLYRNEEDYARIGRVVYAGLDSQKTFNMECPVRRKDGRVITCRLHTSVIGGSLQEGRVLAVCEDITEHKYAVEALRESQRYLADVIDFLPDATFVVDQQGKVTAWNKAMEEMTGVKAEDMLGKGDYEYALPFYGIRRRILIDLASRFDEEVEKQYSFVKKEGDALLAETEVAQRGEKRALWGKARPLFDNMGNLTGAIESIRDITDRKQAEKALREAHDRLEQRVKERTADLRAANEELKRFAYIVSHDLRAPLINLKGFAGELRWAAEKIQSAVGQWMPSMNAKEREEIRVAVYEDVPEALDFIESSVTRMDSLINSILKLSRLGRRELQFESIDMNGLVKDILKTIAHLVETCRARVHVESLPEVTADRISMEQIMGNLFENAIKYLTPDRVGEIRVWGEQGDEFTAFHIQDNGRGIAENDIPKLFEIFGRVGVRDVPGEGMGLAYVQTMVRRHGGHIRCESKPGEGTTFTFTIAKNLAKGSSNET
jgi:PAS domain S-box-containing protein